MEEDIRIHQDRKLKSIRISDLICIDMKYAK